MKKIIALCSMILALAIIVTAFTACGDNKGDDTTTTTQASVSEKSGFTVEISETQALVKKDGKEFQTLKFPINANIKIDVKYATKNNEFIDMNFDGVLDFYVAVNSVDGVVSYYCWLYNATTNKFDYSVILSELKNISIDADNHRILSSVSVDGEKHVLSYKWVDGQLLFDTDYNEDNGRIPEEVTKVVEDNAIGVEKTTTPASGKEETTKKNTGTSSNKTTTKVNKPANTTTTAPSKNNAIVIETGNMNSGWY